AFFGESMFSLKADASKVSLVALAELLKTWNFSFIDCQVTTKHLKSLGAFELPRDKFLEKLGSTINRNAHRGSWSEFAPEIP
ncbi:leucyl/phenylalanyl-tRNA--protein transferase, partial [bacterium]|nr:leucyl/phenylalanyl-tRNA--protein transferase [bacterium]